MSIKTRFEFISIFWDTSQIELVFLFMHFP